MQAIEILKNQFHDHVELIEKRPGIQQVYAPLYHEDGDMVDVFLDIPKNAELSNDQKIRISDHGLTLMRLSYSFDLDTPNKEKIFHRIIGENNVKEADGELFIETVVDSLYPSILHFAQTVAKVCNMRLFKREVIASLFDEMMEEFITTSLGKYNPVPDVCPIADREDLEADWQLSPNGVPLYLFGVKDNSKSRLATITCLEFQKAKLKFKSLVVHEDFEKISRKDRVRLTNACDKQFTSLDQFKENAIEYLEREAVH